MSFQLRYWQQIVSRHPRLWMSESLDKSKSSIWIERWKPMQNSVTINPSIISHSPISSFSSLKQITSLSLFWVSKFITTKQNWAIKFWIHSILSRHHYHQCWGLSKYWHLNEIPKCNWNVVPHPARCRNQVIDWRSKNLSAQNEF